MPSPVWPRPIYLHSWTWHIRFLCSTVLCSIGVYFHHQTHPHWALFLLWPSCFILSGAISSCPCSSTIAYWTPSDLGDSFFGVISFCLFIQFMRFSWQVYWGGLPFPPPVDHVLSELSTMTCLSWVALHGMVHGFNWVMQAPSPQQGSDPWRVSDTHLSWKLRFPLISYAICQFTSSCWALVFLSLKWE